MDITIGGMMEADIPSLRAIQNDNLRTTLPPDQMQDGYLSIAFSEDEFRAFNRDLCVVVARVDGEVAGYCCVSSAAFNADFPILDRIMANLPAYKVPGESQPPAEATSCIYGPACIARPFRGRGILDLMFSRAAMLAEEAGYLFCFSFVSAGNARSLQAHLKLPFQEVGRISHNGNAYIVIACRL
ncbi:MAG: hypothetical protein WD601_11800 [Pseudohongiellaceae bacterium]